MDNNEDTQTFELSASKNYEPNKEIIINYIPRYNNKEKEIEIEIYNPVNIQMPYSSYKKQEEIFRESDRKQKLKEQQLLKQKFKINSYVDENNGNITKLNIKRKNNFNPSQNQSNENLFQEQYKKESDKLQNRANILYGNDIEYSSNRNEKISATYISNETNIKNHQPRISDVEKTLFPDGLMGDMPLKSSDKSLTDAIITILKQKEKTRQTEYMNLNLVELNISELMDIYREQNPNKIPIPILKKFIKTNQIEITKDYLGLNFGIDAIENLLIAKKDHYMNTPYAKQFHIYNSYMDLSSDLRENVKKKIIKQVGIEKLQSTKGIYIDPFSDTAVRLSQNQELVEFIKNNKSSLKKGLTINDSISFTIGNFYYAIGNADIIELKRTKYGELSLLILDIYDFNKNDKRPIVIAGRELQEEGEIIPYFAIYHVIIPRNQANKYLGINNG